MARLFVSQFRRLLARPPVKQRLLYRSIMDQSVSFREATMKDYQDVMAIAEVYYGRDYLPSKYEQFIKSADTKCYVGVLNGDIVSFTAVTKVDDGTTLVGRAGRIKVTRRGQGMGYDMNRFPASSRVLHHTYTSGSLSWDPRKGGSQPHFTETFVKNVNYNVIKRKDLKNLPNDFNNMPNILQSKDLHEVFSSEATSRHLFPNKTLVIDWVPFRLLPANITLIDKMDALILGTNQSGATPSDVIYSCLTIGTYFYCKLGLAYSVDVFGDDVNELRKHLLLHGRNMKNLLRPITEDQADDVLLNLFLEQNVDRAVCDISLRDIGLSVVKDERFPIKMRVYERKCTANI